MGKVIMSGIVPPLVAPVAGILASDIAVGSSVYLMEGGTAVEYLIVNQGKPSGSSLYDASCDGTWLLRKDIHSKRQWSTSNVSIYETSGINTWLNGDFFSSLGSVERATVKQIKIPYLTVGGSGGTIQSGANGLSCNVFLLGGYELGWTTSDYSSFPIDGAKLDYFTVSSGGNSKRIAYLNGSAAGWWSRSPATNTTDNIVWNVNSNGSSGGAGVKESSGVRPALVLPSSALFDKDTLILKGVA